MNNHVKVSYYSLNILCISIWELSFLTLLEHKIQHFLQWVPPMGALTRWNPEKIWSLKKIFTLITVITPISLCLGLGGTCPLLENRLFLLSWSILMCHIVDENYKNRLSWSFDRFKLQSRISEDQQVTKQQINKGIVFTSIYHRSFGFH